MDIPTHDLKVALAVNEVRLEAALEQVSRSSPPSIKVAGVAAINILHAGRKIGLGGLHEQVLVVGHQDKGVKPPAVGLNRAPKANRVALSDQRHPSR